LLLYWEGFSGAKEFGGLPDDIFSELILFIILTLMAGPLMVGTLAWLLITVVAGYFILKEVSSQSNELRREANKKYFLSELEWRWYR
jgi:ABC-type bacteriocin/lantibiotic exporter with double-glycine peptidase domain